MEFSFEDFKKRAKSSSLSKWEKIGFPNSYRENTEHLIFDDIALKLKLNDNCFKILDVGCGCSDLVNHFITYTTKNNGSLYLVDSQEMLDNIVPEYINSKIHLIPGYFPNVDVFNNKFHNYFDRIIVYSVIQYVFLEQSIYSFINKCLEMLSQGGILMIGDIPNFSARERFLQSEEGKSFLSSVNYDNNINIIHDKKERIDDSIIISILTRYRNFGCETYLLPQPKELPFGNRREDILIYKR